MLLVPPPLFRSSVKSASIAYLYHGASNTAATTKTFSAVPFGAGDASRCILVGVCFATGTGTLLNAVTIGGVAATKVITTYSNGVWRSEYWLASVPTGASGNIVLTNSNGTSDQCFIGARRVTDLLSTTPVHVLTGTSTQNQSVNLNVPAGGIAVGIRATQNSTIRTHTWTGIVENFDFTYFASVGGGTGACNAFAAEQAPLAITCNASGAAAAGLARYASFR